MLRYFSRILIFTLILTAPLSFTGDKCPDFKPNCELKETLRNKAATVIVQQRTAIQGHIQDKPLGFETTTVCLTVYSFRPSIRFSLSPLHERAPPLTPLAIA